VPNHLSSSASKVEQVFSAIKSILQTRPATIRQVSPSVGMSFASSWPCALLKITARPWQSAITSSAPVGRCFRRSACQSPNDPGGIMTLNASSKGNLWCQPSFQETYLVKIIEVSFNDC